MGVIADALRASLAEMAASDARLYRGLDEHLRSTRRRLAELEALQPAAASNTEAKIAAAIALLEEHGYTVTR